MRQATKLKGGPALSLRSRLVLGTALATSAFGGGYRGYVRRAYANCTPGASVGTFICSDNTTATQTLTGTPLTVTTDDTFSITTAAGNALTLTGTGGLKFSDLTNGVPNFSTITGQDLGMQAYNRGTGELSITTTGIVTGTTFTIGEDGVARGGQGIGAINFAGTTDLTINAADVTG